MAKLNWKTPNGNSGNVDLDKIFTTDGGTINGDTTVQSSTAELDIKNSSNKKGSASTNFGKLKFLDSDGKMVASLEAYSIAAGMRFALRLYPNIDSDETNQTAFFVQNSFGAEDNYSALFGIEPPLNVNNSTIPTTSWVRKILSSLDIPTITVSNDSELDNLNRNVFFEGHNDSRFPNIDFNGISIVTPFQVTQIIITGPGPIVYRVNDEIPFSPNNWTDFIEVAKNTFVVHLTGDEVIKGTKCFNNRTKFASSIDFIDNEVEHGRLYNNSNALRLVSGTDTSDGAFLDLNRIDDNDSSSFRIAARSSSIVKELLGYSDGRLIWDGNNVALAKDFLPLSGGIMTGMLNMNGSSINMGSSYTDPKGRLYSQDDHLRITGGSNTSDGSWLDLYTSTSGNGFTLNARNSSGSTTLQGKQDGTLLWGGRHIVRSMGVQGGSEGYQTFSTNIAIEWGTANFNGAKYVDVTLPLSLVGVYGAYGVDAVSESSTGLQSSNGAIAWAYGNNTTSSGLVTKIRFVSDATNIAVFKYFVIGRI